MTVPETPGNPPETPGNPVLDAAVASRKPPVKDPSVIEYESYSNFPSFCQIAHRRHATPAGERVQFALIHMPHGGVSPTNMIESLATHLRQQFYPKVDPGKIDWFDVVPPNTYSSFDKLTINSVSLEHANGVYSHPSWSPANDNIPEDFAAFILDTIARDAEVPRPRRIRPARCSRPLKKRLPYSNRLSCFFL